MAVAVKSRPTAQELATILERSRDRAMRHEGAMRRAVASVLRDAGNTAADNFQTFATEHLTAGVDRDGAVVRGGSMTHRSPGLFQDDGHSPDQAMVALRPLPAEADALALPGGEPPAYLHVSLAILQGPEVEDRADELAQIVADVAKGQDQLAGGVTGVGAFKSKAKFPLVALPDAKGLLDLRERVMTALADGGFPPSESHDYIPHVTLAYADEPELPDPRVLGLPLTFQALTLARGGQEDVDARFGLDALAAAALLGYAWTPPVPDEMLNLDELIAELRTKTDPVRLATIQAATENALIASGLSFDVTNPLVRGMVDKAATHVTSIAETTRQQLQAIVGRAYDQGLSIPDTAKFIRASMVGASDYRSTMIARTEMTRVVNAGQTAAMGIVSDATGTTYSKTWLTAPGAEHPRHEDYDGLDGQTVALDQLFDVGGNPFAFPGDPDGAPEDSINCRCTLTYGDGSDALPPPDQAPGLDEAALQDATDNADATVAADQMGIPVPATPPPGDFVSVPLAPFVPPDVVARVAQLHLNLTPEAMLATRSDLAKATLDGFDSTETKWKVGHTAKGAWMEERAASAHDPITEAYFRGKTANPEGGLNAYFTAGGGASGKSSATFLSPDGVLLNGEELGKRADTIYINADDVKAMLDEGKILKDAKDPYFAQATHEESSYLANLILRRAMQEGYNVVLDSTGSSGKFISKLPYLGRSYRTQVSMVSNPVNTAIARMVARGDGGSDLGRYVQIGALKDGHRGASANLPIWSKLKSIDSWRLVDTGGDNNILVAEGGRGKEKIYDRARWKSILDKGNPLPPPVETAPGPELTALPHHTLEVPSVYYHITYPENAASIRERGLLTSSEAGGRNGEFPTGTFLATPEQARSLATEFRATHGVDPAVVKVTLPSGTVVYDDPLMTHGSVIVHGGIPAGQIQMVDAGAIPFYPGPTDAAVQRVRDQWAHKATTLAVQNGVSKDAYLAEADKVVADAVKDAEVRIRVPSDTLGQVLKEGRFKSQFESGASRGLYDPSYRTNAERTGFGYEASGKGALDPKLRPIYGYLAGSKESGAVNMYGDAIVRLKPEVRDRTTFTLTDSLGEVDRGTILPQPIENPSVLAALPGLPDDIVGVWKYRTASEPLDGISYPYAEAQIHGGVTLNDIAEVIIRDPDRFVPFYESRVQGLQSELAYAKQELADATANNAGEAVLDRFNRDVERATENLAEGEKNLQKALSAKVTLRELLDAADVAYRFVDDPAEFVKTLYDVSKLGVEKWREHRQQSGQ